MVNGNLFELPGLPEFPTAFTEKDVKRLRDLEEQRKKIEEVYQGKFTQEAWAKVPAPEKVIRRVLPSWTAPIVELLTPQDWGLDFGFTPEQAEKERLEVEEEYRELVRRRRITQVLPSVKNTLRALALTDEDMVTDLSELRTIFKLDELGFTEEEASYVSAFAQRLVRATPEEIISGEVFELQPLTQEEVDELARTAGEPRRVLTTVAFSKNIEDITAALKDMYAPQVDDSRRDAIIKEFAEKELMGATRESTEEAFGKIAEEGGGVLILTNTETGQMFSASKRSDSSVWVEGELVGYFDEDTGQLAPYNMNTGQPMKTEEEQEGVLKDLWDSLYLGTQTAWYGTKQGVLRVLKDIMTPQTIKDKEGVEYQIGTGGFPGQKELYKNLIGSVDEQVEKNEVKFQVWLGEHPELAPRAEYTQSPIEHPELLLDPYFYAYTILSNAPVIGAALFVGISTSLATKNPWIGAAAGAAVITPVQINSLYEDLVANGADPENANELAVSIGTLIGAVEIFPAMLVLKAASPAFMTIFRRNLQKEVTKQLVTQLTLRGVLTTATKIEVAEVLEEVVQEAMQNAAVKTVNENRGIFDNIPETAINAAIATFPLAVFGGGAQYIGMKQNLAPAVREELDTTAKEVEEAGLTPEHAEAVAYSKLLETETGQAAVLLAIEKFDAEIPAAPIEKSSKVESLENKLTATNNDITRFTEDLATQEERLSKTTLPYERTETQETIDGMSETLSELEIAKTKLEKQLKRLNKAEVASLRKAAEARPPVDEFERRLTGELTKGQREITEARAVEPEVREEAPDRRPKLREWEDEEASVEQALDKSPVIARKIKVSPKIVDARTTAANTLNALQDEYQKAENVDARKETEAKLKAMAKEAGFSVKTLLGQRWGDLSPTQQMDLAVSLIPDRSLHIPKILELADIKHYVRFLEEETGLPFYQLYPRMRQDFGASQRAGELVLQRLNTDPLIRNVKTNKEAQVRATQQINSKNPRLNVPPVEDLVEEENLLVQTVEDILEHYEPYVRYLRVMGTDSDIESFKLEFPDAVDAGKEVELELAIELKETGNVDDLWSFLQTVDWGIIVGYTPWMKAKASIFPKQIRLGTTRGEARLMQRSSIDFDETLGETLLLDVVRYVKQIEAQWRLRPELEMYEDMWKKVEGKFANNKRVEGKLKMWAKELQGMPVEGSIADDIINRLWKQSMSTVFVHLYMSYRNIHQAIAFHPDRTELIRLFAQPMPPALKEKAGIYYDTFVTQLGGIKMDFLLSEGKGIPGLGWLTNMSDRLSLYSHSDNIPRRWSFQGSVNKAWRATQKYASSNKTAGDLDTWVKDSGVNHLTQTERNYALQLLAQGEENINLAVPGLAEVSGYENVSFYIGHEMADVTHFIYRRAFRAVAEMGSSGRLLYNLIVFPRSYVQRIVLQSQKIGGIFHPDTNWETARAGFKDVLLLLVVGSFVSEWLRFITGKERKAYNALEIVQWQLGGLAIGVGQDVAEMIGAILTSLDVTASDEDRKRASDSLPRLVERNAQVLVPFYRYTIDAIESAAGVEDVGVHTAVKELRAALDEDYTPPEIEEKERSLWEALRHAVLGSEPQDPTVFEEIQTSLRDNEARLGERDALGKFYTLKEFGSQIASSTKPLPDYTLLDDYSFSPLTIFYVESKDKWGELYKLPTSPASIRKEWRVSHLEEEAMLLFWGKYSRSVFTLGTPEWEEVSRLLRTWFGYYNIDARMHGKWADWALPGA